MGVLQSTRARLFDSLRKRELTLLRFLLHLLEDSLGKREFTLLRVLLQLPKFLRCMGEIPMFTICLRPYVYYCLHHELGIS
jgi:hypothetical protein